MSKTATIPRGIIVATKTKQEANPALDKLLAKLMKQERHKLSIQAQIMTPTVVALQRKLAEVEEANSLVREAIQIAMETHNVKSFENEAIKLTYVAPTQRRNIDTALLRDEMPDIAERYTKTVDVKGSVRIKVK